ncbi:MAG: LysM peptidoglycan-binding domain-containing protein [Ruminococcaceae bacterium]|nr:LysM peptidoglycan-binding domain-containing protein [Oscillospiraceae bacterium]
MTIHVVSAGETAQAIAEEYGVSPAFLIADNEIPSDGALAVGQTLVIRFPRQVHSVREGESLTSIAAAYRTTIRRLWQNNWQLGGGTALYPGQTLVISYLEPPIGRGFFNGYAYPFISQPLMNQQLPYLSSLTPFTYGISADGGLLPLNDDALLSSARQHGTRPVLHLSSYTEEDTFDTQRAAMVLTEPEVQNRLIGELQRTMTRKEFAGVDVDFEYLPATLAVPYAEFLARLRKLFNPQGRFVWAALAPKSSRSQPGLLYEGHDYAAIGAAVNGVLLMTYEWGYTYGPPMAVAPLPQVQAVLDYALTEIPSDKIFLGIPNYGYDWPLPFQQGITRARSISSQEAIRLAIQYQVAIQYDEAAQAPFFHYTNTDGILHEVWFEDARSMEAKLRLVAEMKLRGAGYWNIMRPFSQTWLTLASLFEIE